MRLLEEQLAAAQAAAADTAAQRAEADASGTPTAAAGAAAAGAASEEEVAAMRAKLAKAKRQFQARTDMGAACLAEACIYVGAACHTEAVLPVWLAPVFLACHADVVPACSTRTASN